MIDNTVLVVRRTKTVDLSVSFTVETNELSWISQITLVRKYDPKVDSFVRRTTEQGRP